MAIKDLYINISTKETISVTENVIKQNHLELINKEMVILLKTIINQNYFQYEEYYELEMCIAKGSQISSIIAEMFLQNLEQQIIKHALKS
jgi:hypothetical protein